MEIHALIKHRWIDSDSICVLDDISAYARQKLAMEKNFITRLFTDHKTSSMFRGALSHASNFTTIYEKKCLMLSKVVFSGLRNEPLVKCAFGNDD